MDHEAIMLLLAFFITLAVIYCAIPIPEQADADSSGAPPSPPDPASATRLEAGATPGIYALAAALKLLSRNSTPEPKSVPSKL
jgi:hypothetical protein